MRTYLRGLSISGFLALLVLTGWIQWQSLGEPVDRLILDRAFELLRRHRPQPVPQDVVVIGVDERTFARFAEPFALWHHHLGRLFKALATAKPSVVGVDIPLPERSYEALLPGYDQALLEGLMTLRAFAPVVLVRTLDEYGNFREIFAPYVAVAGDNAQATALLCPDPDEVVRRADQTTCNANAPVGALAFRMADALGSTATRRGMIDYGVGDAIDYVPLSRVLEWLERDDRERLVRAFGGRPVLVGAVLPTQDRFRVPIPLAVWEPLNQRVPGVLVHAQTLRSLLKNGLMQPVPPVTVGLLTGLACLFWFGRGGAIKWTAFLSFLVLVFGLRLYFMWHTQYLPTAEIQFAAALAFFARSGLEYVTHLHERNLLRASFAAYVSPQVLRRIYAGDIQPGLDGTRARIAVLCSDIRGFSARADGLDPPHVMRLLNDYFTPMIGVAQKHGGTIDKFVGDGMMVYFGAPQPLPCPEKSALEAAHEMLIALRHLNAEFVRAGGAPLRIGIGIHVGDAVVGHVGTDRLHQYTAIGDVIGTAIRLEALSKTLDFPVILSGTVADGVGGAGGLVDLGARPLDGTTAIRVFGWNPPTGPATGTGG